MSKAATKVLDRLPVAVGATIVGRLIQVRAHCEDILADIQRLAPHKIDRGTLVQQVFADVTFLRVHADLCLSRVAFGDGVERPAPETPTEDVK